MFLDTMRPSQREEGAYRLPDGGRAGGSLARRRGQHGLGLVQRHDLIEVAGVEGLGEDCVHLLGFLDVDA
ncbi:hypothetical protein [Sorangium sp. So ce1151]|uniref:hypothetical protein n=1 Tax=Sorangium sp. So ce1151 TaxID=3133332 RepID=UPI003F62826E